MGSRFGVPFVAEEPRIRAAVLGFAGTSAGPYMLPAAAEVRVPLLFVANMDDAVFPFPGNLELFNALGSEDKRMHVLPGGHGTLPADEPATMAQFLADRLRGGADA
jgi:pimeloyl-ACP methyl ester carboxylesterase